MLQLYCLSVDRAHVGSFNIFFFYVFNMYKIGKILIFLQWKSVHKIPFTFVDRRDQRHFLCDSLGMKITTETQSTVWIEYKLHRVVCLKPSSRHPDAAFDPWPVFIRDQQNSIRCAVQYVSVISQSIEWKTAFSHDCISIHMWIYIFYYFVFPFIGPSIKSHSPLFSQRGGTGKYATDIFHFVFFSLYPSIKCNKT